MHFSLLQFTKSEERDRGGDGGRRWERKARRRRWGAGGCSMGVKRLPEVGDGGGDR